MSGNGTAENPARIDSGTGEGTFRVCVETATVWPGFVHVTACRDEREALEEAAAWASEHAPGWMPDPEAADPEEHWLATESGYLYGATVETLT